MEKFGKKFTGREEEDSEKLVVKEADCQKAVVKEVDSEMPAIKKDGENPVEEDVVQVKTVEVVKNKITRDLINRLMDEAIDLGCVDSKGTHEYVKDELRKNKYEYDFNELFIMEMEYEAAHQGIYVECFYEIEAQTEYDPYASDGINFKYHFLKHQVYYNGYHHVAGGFGWGGSGAVKMTDWDYVYDKVKNHEGRKSLTKEVWERVKEDMNIYSEKPESYLKFLKLVEEQILFGGVYNPGMKQPKSMWNKSSVLSFRKSVRYMIKDDPQVIDDFIKKHPFIILWKEEIIQIMNKFPNQA